MNLDQYRSLSSEQLRTESLLSMLPSGYKSILEIGARDGFHSAKLTESFSSVTALDLEKPPFSVPGVHCVAGDVTQLEFADAEFDCLLCSEVLEHVPDLEKAAREIQRVTRYAALIGVPCEQDTRVGRLTCGVCGRTNPPFGHVNTFDEAKLRRLFAGMRAGRVEKIAENRDATNFISCALNDYAGNPWGTYDQEEPCIHCGAAFVEPPPRSLPQKAASRLAHVIDRLQSPWVRPHANWIHILFVRDDNH